MHHLLIIDDDQTVLRGIELNLEDFNNFRVETASTKKKALKLLAEKEFDLVVSDLMIPETRDGLEIIQAASAQWYRPTIMVMTAHESLENAVRTMQAGADDFIAKGFGLDEFIFRIENLIKNRDRIGKLERENRILREVIQTQYSDYQIIGDSAAIKGLKNKIKKVAADAKSTCLILGESGTGKELVARNIHLLSPRKNGPFVPINCAAIPQNLIESEFFGHERGSFTGADSTQQGKFEIARNGIIFLDEIAELPLPLQVRLLRVIEEKSFYRIGGKVPIEVDVMILAATNRDLKELVAEGKFREDLFFRLNVITLTVPPLRERQEDIALLVKFFLDNFNRERRRNVKITRRAMRQLQGYNFFGNVRELRNVIEDAFVLCENNEIDSPDLSVKKRGGQRMTATGTDVSFFTADGKELPFHKAQKRFEKAYFARLLEKNAGTMRSVAKEAGMTREWLSKKLKQLGL
jgi:DNA-binding NtrC family response regulator